MNKMKFTIIGAFIIVLLIEIFSFAAEVKNNPSAASNAPAASAVPAVAPAQVQQKPVLPAATAPAVAPAQVQQTPSAPTATDNYSYNPTGKPDPFRPLVEPAKPKNVEAKTESKKKSELSMFPLQRNETESYRVVGIAGDKDHRVAIVEDTGKKFYPLVIGTHIGLYNGKVIEILADRVIIEEYQTKKANRVILKLRKNYNEVKP
jgi:type IV pilus assembly protein PilP